MDGVGHIGMVMVKSNAAIAEEERRRQEEAERARGARAPGASPYVQTLGELEKAWQEAVTEKTDIEQDLLADLRQRVGEYDAATLDKIHAIGGSEAYDNITEVKCAALEAWISDIILFQPDDQPWDVKPTPIPSLPEEIARLIEQEIAERQQAFEEATGALLSEADLAESQTALRDLELELTRREADKRAGRMREKIRDILQEGHFEDVFLDFLVDFATYRAAFLKGPIPRLAWSSEFEQVDGVTRRVRQEVVQIEFSAPSPFDIFYSPGSVNVWDGYLIERLRMKPGDLEALKGLPNYFEEEITALLEERKTAKPPETTADSERARLEGKLDTLKSVTAGEIILREYWGTLTGEALAETHPELGLRPEDEREVRALFGNGRLIGLDPDPPERPYSKTSFRGIPRSFWGKSVPYLIRKCQDTCNSCTRSLHNMLAMMGGPVVAIDASMLPPGVDIQRLHPWQILQFVLNGTVPLSNVLHIEQFRGDVAAVLRTRQEEDQRADSASGVPPYSYGSDVAAGAGKTLGGLSILMTSAARGVKRAIASIDKDVIKPIVRRVWALVMAYDPDESLKGDVQIVARGALAMFVRETLAARQADLLRAVSNPNDMAIIGPRGRAKQLREAFHAAQVDPDGIVPDDDEMRAREEGQESQATPTPTGGAAGAMPAAPASRGAGAMPRPPGRVPGQIELPPGAMEPPPGTMGNKPGGAA